VRGAEVLAQNLLRERKLFRAKRTGPEISRRTQDENIDWAKVAQVFATSDDKLIAQRFGTSWQRIHGRAKREGWRRPLAGIDGRALAAAEEAEGARRQQIVARLFKALDEKMTQIEERIGRGGTEPPSPQDSERDARALVALAGLYAKLVALDEAARNEGRGELKPEAKKAGRDADAFREDLARRLRRLHPGGDA